MVGIDTIILTLPLKDFVIMEPSRFTTNAMKVLNASPRDMGRGKYTDAYCNPTKQDTATFGYLPILTLYRALRAGGLVTELRVQLSAPKMLNGENFSEIEEWDFGELCHRILAGLDYYKIKVYDGLKTISSARVASVHYSKNFVLANYMSVRNAVLELQKSDVNAWRDVSQTDYINNGYGFKTHSKYHELAFYDKMAEYNKGKRGQPLFDQDTQLSFDLFNERQPQKPFEVLRMEVRLGNGKAIKYALEKARLPTDDLSLNAIFRQDYSQMVLEWHLQDLYSRYPKITEAATDDALELFSDLYVQNPERHMSTIIAAIGLHTLSKTAGSRAMKDIVGSRGSPALLRLAKKANKELRYKTEKSEVFEHLRQELDRFQPVHLDDYLK
jgi:hypothetical protein